MSGPQWREVAGVRVGEVGGGGPTAVVLPDQPEGGVCDPDAPGVRALVAGLSDRGVSVRLVDAGNSWYVRKGPTPEWFRDALRPTLEGPCGLVGVGVGGQGALAAAYRRGDLWPVAAAVAPAGDLGRWWGRGTSLDNECRDADEARQAEAHLFFNPLSRPASQLIWCDPRDEACYPTALRAVSKVQSSGVRAEADLTTEAGESRDGYLLTRAGELAEWVAGRLEDAASRVP